MPYFVVYALDKPGTEVIRRNHRPAHRARLRDPGKHPVKVHIGGPLTDAAGAMNGSMLVIESANAEDARHFVEADPYTLAGLYASVEIRPYLWGLGQPQEAVDG